MWGRSRDPESSSIVRLAGDSAEQYRAESLMSDLLERAIAWRRLAAELPRLASPRIAAAGAEMQVHPAPLTVVGVRGRTSVRD
jgi:hypothetical protein